VNPAERADAEQTRRSHRIVTRSRADGEYGGFTIQVKAGQPRTWARVLAVSGLVNREVLPDPTIGGSGAALRLIESWTYNQPRCFMTISRVLGPQLLALASRHPVVTLTGPRQSGKTTLCRALFPDRPYRSLEAPDMREYARTDPRGFLSDLGEGGVIDEIQRVPDLVSYIQEAVDARPTSRRYVLTGSYNLGLLQSVSQSLAGRTAFAELLPFSLDEVRLTRSGVPSRLDDALFQGGYPALFDRDLPPAEWLGAYVTAYVERDVRQVLGVGDLLAFQAFLGVCAGRAGQLINLTALGSDVGISHNTARAWLSVLEACFVAFRIPPWSRNIERRSVRTPKLYFHDTGLLCFLLGVRSADQLRTHPLRGAVFENWVVTEFRKARVHRGSRPEQFFFRDRAGLEVDLLVDRGDGMLAVEIKAGATVAADFLRPLARLAVAWKTDLERKPLEPVLVYGGEAAQRRSGAPVVPWAGVADFAESVTPPAAASSPERRTGTSPGPPTGGSAGRR